MSRIALAVLAVLPAWSLDHSAWDKLLNKYVNAESRVDYARWKNSADQALLDQYLAQLAQPPAVEDKAALIDAYNAFVVRWILQNYPVSSIWKTKNPFTEARHTLGGAKISLDSIETKLRATGDPRIHAALVCAARSCPPLRREAYTSDRLDAQLDDNTRAWLANSNLNEFHEAGSANVSSIFKWYGDDFQKGGQSLAAFLARHGPPPAKTLKKIEYKSYHWGLNDQGSLGADYSGGLKLLWDYLRSK